MELQIALQANNGGYLVATGESGQELRAEGEIGAWQIFRLFNQTRPGEMPRHGDSVVLQAWTGRFVAAVGGGGSTLKAELGWIESSTTLTIEKVSGSGEIRFNDEVALRAANGNYVVAEDGGGNVVSANRERRGPWETFRIKMFQPQLVRLRASNRRYVTAEEGGGAQMTVNQTDVGLWETFSLINLSRAERTIQTGDTVAIQVWNEKFIQVDGSQSTEVNSKANRTPRSAQFIVRASGVTEIGQGQVVNLQSLATSKFITARSGVLVADSTSAASEAAFSIEFAENAGIDFRWLPNGSALPERPLASSTFPVRGNKRLLILHLDDGTSSPLSASNEQIAANIFGARPSLAEWFRTMSGGACTVSVAGVYGPIRIQPRATVSQILTAAEQQGVPLASFAKNGVIDGNEVALLRLALGSGGQAGYVDEVSQGGIRYRGWSAGVGVSSNVDEASRMVIAHEVSHMFLDIPDRYHLPVPVRGDVVATSERANSSGTFVIERVAGTGNIRVGDQVRLRAQNGNYLAVSPTQPNFINLEGAGASNLRVFTIAAGTGTGEITSGSWVTFRSTTGRYMTAELGGGSVLTANRSSIGDWEPFEISKISGNGVITSGDRVSLKSKSELFVVAESNARDKGEELQAHERSALYKWRDTNSGQGAGFDNATANYRTVMLSVFDRIRYGWVQPKYLTPDNKGCYLLRPFLDHRESLILFDPRNPKEWYTVENRQHVPDRDEVQSSGIVISWICEDQGYWQWWFNHRGDTHTFDKRARYPVAISAVASRVPPNPLAAPVLIAHEWLYKRNHPNAAFRDQSLVLPLGNGDPSRFHLSFHPGEAGNIAVCIR